jgi:hypothetical protein
MIANKENSLMFLFSIITYYPFKKLHLRKHPMDVDLPIQK